MSKKTAVSRGIRYFKEGIKKSGALLAAKALGPKSYPFFGVPCGVEERVEGALGEQRFLYPKMALVMQPPQSVETPLYWKFQAILNGMEVPEEGILTLNQGTATSKGGNLSLHGSLVAPFHQRIDGKLPHQNDLFNFSSKRFFPKIYKADRPVISLTAGWQGAFYHWVYEVLPRFHLVEKGGFGLEQIYIEIDSPFQGESLELMGVKKEQMINAKEYSAVHAPQIIFPSIPETPTDWGCAYLRSRFLPAITKKEKFRLYVSRSDAGRRRIVNEEEVFSFLKRYGFKKIELTRLSFKEQIEVFEAAEVVVGPHGAGFSHLAFCNPGTPLLEIFSPAYVNPCYWHVCERVGLPYYYLFGEGERYPDFKETGLDPDIHLDLKKLEDSLKLMGL